jgi:hypothetical protein
VFVFDAHDDKVKTWIASLDFAESEVSEQKSDRYPFAVEILEDMVDNSCDILDRRIRLLSPMANNLLNSTMFKGTGGSLSSDDANIRLQKVIPLQDALSDCERQVRTAPPLRFSARLHCPYSLPLLIYVFSRVSFIQSNF